MIFSYGVTNAGKTHTIIGTKEDPGILPRSLAILNQVKDFIDKNCHNPNAILDLGEFEFAMSSVFWLGDDKELKITSANLYFEAFEIYNEDIYDLLPGPIDRKIIGMNKPKLQIKEKENRQIYIKDLNRIEIDSQKNWTTLLETCLANRSVGDNNINYRSSRSHTFFKLIMRLNYSSPQMTHHVETTLCVVDLAGAERAKKTTNSGLELAEAGKINQSLMILARCIKALADPNPSTIVPHRDSKLTRILFDYFNENSNLTMIANINPAASDFEESLRVLNYAAQTKEIHPVRSKIDSIRKSVINFPYAALNRSKIIEESTNNDAFSLLDDTVLKGFLEDKENQLLNFEQKLLRRQDTNESNEIVVENLQHKLKQTMQEISEKDEKIQMLEGKKASD